MLARPPRDRIVPFGEGCENLPEYPCGAVAVHIFPRYDLYDLGHPLSPPDPRPPMAPYRRYFVFVSHMCFTIQISFFLSFSLMPFSFGPHLRATAHLLHARWHIPRHLVHAHIYARWRTSVVSSTSTSWRDGARLSSICVYVYAQRCTSPIHLHLCATAHFSSRPCPHLCAVAHLQLLSLFDSSVTRHENKNNAGMLSRAWTL
jgi:hypothetical protein